MPQMAIRAAAADSSMTSRFVRLLHSWRQAGVSDQLLRALETADRTDAGHDRSRCDNADSMNAIQALRRRPLLENSVHRRLHLVQPLAQLIQLVELRLTHQPIPARGRLGQPLQTPASFLRPQPGAILPRFVSQVSSQPVPQRGPSAHQILTQRCQSTHLSPPRRRPMRQWQLAIAILPLQPGRIDLVGLAPSRFRR